MKCPPVWSYAACRLLISELFRGWGHNYMGTAALTFFVAAFSLKIRVKEQVSPI